MAGWLESSKEKTRIVCVPTSVDSDNPEMSPWVWRARLKLEEAMEAVFTTRV